MIRRIIAFKQTVMRWRGREKSKNVIDQRKGTGRKVGAGIGIGTILLLVLGLFMGEDPAQLLDQVLVQSETPAEAGSQPDGNRSEEDELADFVRVVLKDTEDVWTELFPKQIGANYTVPELVLFSDLVQSACGSASAATGPFYCPADQRIYIDLSFYQQLSERFGAPGDFAMAYVIAHEVGHHVQYLVGITDQVHRRRGQISQEAFNDLSVRLELQADFLAGVWAHHGQKQKRFLEEGDIEEALRAASAIGDDKIQLQTQGYVVPDAFTHGTSEQRMRWFYKGYETGDVGLGNTFDSDAAL